MATLNMVNVDSSQQRYEIGMIGLGVMGRNLLLNISENGFSVAGYDRDVGKVEALRQEAKSYSAYGAEKLEELISVLRPPRAVILLVPAGAPVDAVIKELLPLLQKGDIIIDAGNSYYKDTNLRTRDLAAKGVHFFGVGISGGEEGARRGPSIMPGGSSEVYKRLQPIFEAVAAKVNGDPCVTYLGPGSAGHFVKMVHNGIEYGLMQLISETYDLMKRALGMNDDEIQAIYINWNKNELSSYLIEITSHIFGKKDEQTGKRLIDKILDVARQKGTGMWTSQCAMELQVPTPTIDLAVGMRNLSMLEEQRKQASLKLPHAIQPYQGDRQQFLLQMRNALYVAFIVTYAQGMAILTTASTKLNYQLNLESVARIWRGGCIIRAALLEDIRKAYQKEPTLSNLLLDSEFSSQVMRYEEDLRHLVMTAVSLGVPVPCLTATISYLDSYRSFWLPANLIQAQRDYFGAHTYERIDAKGTFHTEWEKI